MTKLNLTLKEIIPGIIGLIIIYFLFGWLGVLLLIIVGIILLGLILGFKKENPVD